MTQMATVSFERHQNKFWRRFSDCGFAQPLCDVPLVLAEILPATSAFPVILRGTGDALRPYALLGSDPAQGCAFVTKEGAWCSHYMPAALRIHPFGATAVVGDGGQEGAFELLVDESTGYVTDDIRDERFFDPDGTVSAALQEVIAFQNQYMASYKRTTKATRFLLDAGVLRPFTVKGVDPTLHQGSWQVDGPALEILDGDVLQNLMQTGALQLAHAMMVSLGMLGPLIRVSAAPKESQFFRHPHETMMTGDFLSALAQAQENDKEDMFMDRQGA